MAFSPKSESKLLPEFPSLAPLDPAVEQVGEKDSLMAFPAAVELKILGAGFHLLHLTQQHDDVAVKPRTEDLPEFHICKGKVPYL